MKAEQAAEALKLLGYSVSRSRRLYPGGRSRGWIVGLKVHTGRGLVRLLKRLREMGDE